MLYENVFERIQAIFRDIFDDEELVITGETNSEHIEDWDSLNHIQLVVTIEQEFKIRFSLGELQDLKNVSEMINLLLAKINE